MYNDIATRQLPQGLAAAVWVCTLLVIQMAGLGRLPGGHRVVPPVALSVPVSKPVPPPVTQALVPGLKRQMDAVSSPRFKAAYNLLVAMQGDVRSCARGGLSGSGRRKLTRTVIDFGNAGGADVANVGGLFLRLSQGDTRRASRASQAYEQCLKALEKDADRETAARLQTQRSNAALANLQRVNAQITPLANDGKPLTP